MRKAESKSTVQRSLIFLLGIAVAFMSLTVDSTSLQPNEYEPVTLEQGSEVEDEHGETVTFKVDHPAALSSMGQVMLVHEWRLILDVVLPDDTQKSSTYVIEQFSSALFKTLFRRIISPNAP